MSLTSQTEKPATSSRVSANGPSITVRWEPFANDALGLCAVLEAGGGHEYAGLDQLLSEPVHRRETPRPWAGAPVFTVLRGLPKHHNPQSFVSSSEPTPLASHRDDERA